MPRWFALVIVPTLANYGFTFSSCGKAGDFIDTPHHAGFLDEEDNGIESIEAQTQQGLKNLGKALNAAGASLDDVVKTLGLLRNSEDFKGDESGL
jgi:enamine deaminase RidA (YjgF/YER057c/UK114 family)